MATSPSLSPPCPVHRLRCAGYWLQMLGASLPTASTYFL
jgi:hypothetical protein